MSSLTEDSSSELSEELMKNQSVVHDDNFHNEDDVEDWENWQPDPVDADPGWQLITLWHYSQINTNMQASFVTLQNNDLV